MVSIDRMDSVIEILAYLNALFIMIFGAILVYILYDMHKISITIQNLEMKHQITNKKNIAFRK